MNLEEMLTKKKRVKSVAELPEVDHDLEAGKVPEDLENNPLHLHHLHPR